LLLNESVVQEVMPIVISDDCNEDSVANPVEGLEIVLPNTDFWSDLWLNSMD
jgi:hypothetical protein